MGITDIFSKSNTGIARQVLKDYNAHRPLGPQQKVCYAPFKNMYFFHHGRAAVCCYNKTYILGEYPAMSIKEMWQGESAQKLRGFISKNDLSQGCFSCENQLKAGNFDAVKAKQYDEQKINENGYPSVMEFELSNLCNLECEMCNGDFSSLIRAKREKRPPIENPYNAAFVDQLEEFIPHLEEVKFYGGEPFLIEIYYDIWERILKINPGVRISVQTNGTVLNNRVKRILENTNFHLNISFDSLKKDTYEQIRKNANFERVSENIEWFYNYCKQKDTFFGISVCAMQQNWDELPGFINYCNKLDVPVYFHTVYYPLNCSIRGMKAEAIEPIVTYLSGFDFQAETPIQKKNRTHYFDFVNQVKAWHKQALNAAGEKKLESFTDLRDRAIEHIKANKMMAEHIKARKIERVYNKFTELEKRLEPEFIERSLARIDPNSGSFPDVLDKVAYYSDKLPLNALVLLIKSSFK